MNFTELGLNLGIVFGVVGLTEAIKVIIFKGKATKIQAVLVTVALGAIAAIFVTSPFSWQGYGEKTFSYAGVACIAYMLGGKNIFGGKK